MSPEILTDLNCWINLFIKRDLFVYVTGICTFDWPYMNMPTKAVIRWHRYAVRSVFVEHTWGWQAFKAAAGDKQIDMMGAVCRDVRIHFFL